MRDHGTVAARLIVEARRQAKLTQAQLATRVGMRQPDISAYETGKTQPTLPTLFRILAGTGMQPQIELSERPDGSSHPSTPRPATTDDGRQPATDPLSAVLAALVRAPRGLPTTAAIAARSGTPVAEAQAALDDLATDDRVVRISEMRLVAGASTPVDVWYANLDHPQVRSRLRELNEVDLPTPKGDIGDRLPDNLRHLFWNAAPEDVSPREHGVLIAHRAMVSSDPEGLAWAVAHLPAQAFVEALGFRDASPADAAWLAAATP